MIDIALELTNFNVIYKEKIFSNVIKCIPFVESNIRDGETIGKPEVTMIDLFYLDESNRLRIMRDKNDKFQFVRK